MYYFLKSENFNLEEYDFDIQCNPRFTKKEHDVFSKFVSNFRVDQDFSEFAEKELKMDKDEIQKTIHNLTKKTIYCCIFKENVEISKFYFNIFDIVVSEENKIIYKFSNELRLTKKKGSFYSRINVLAFLQFKYSYTKEIFKAILRPNKRKGYIEYTLDEIKELLEIAPDKYNRYYDLENKVFNPTIKDIEFGEINIWYEKIKNSNLKNSRITGVRIHFVNIYHVEVHRAVNEILKINADYIDDFTQAYEIIYSYRKIHTSKETIDYVKNNLETIFKNS